MMGNELILGDSLLKKGTLRFSIESRILRELGERLVKQPEVAIIELIKNAYDADATDCEIEIIPQSSITIIDDGHGMTLDQFTKGWMRVGTDIKEQANTSKLYGRLITGEKGIGRFAARFLGKTLHLDTVAIDPQQQIKTRLTAAFDWPSYDKYSDLGSVNVPFELFETERSTRIGTTLRITDLSNAVDKLNFDAVRTGAIDMVSPLRSLFPSKTIYPRALNKKNQLDPGFKLHFRDQSIEDDSGDVAKKILAAFVLRATLRLKNDKFVLKIYTRESRTPYLIINDTFSSEIEHAFADIRFFPKRKGTFTNLPLDGRKAQGWIKDNHGIAVFDRSFRVPPYGYENDDWLLLTSDAARKHRLPRSSIAKKYFPMDRDTLGSPGLNWMLRLPQSLQLVGIVHVEGTRLRTQHKNREIQGLVVAADREGFLHNEAFRQLRNLVRGSVEAIAFVDRKIQIETKNTEQIQQLREIDEQTQDAIEQIRANPHISQTAKRRIVATVAQSSKLAAAQYDTFRERERHLETMSLLGVVAGFMTHEFGIALQELQDVKNTLAKFAHLSPEITLERDKFSGHIKQLQEFVKYSTAYIHGARISRDERYPVKPRLDQVIRVFGKYAKQRNITVKIETEVTLVAPQVPAAMYNGIALNLFTNALKAITAKVGRKKGTILFRARNDGRWHFLEVSDTGVGVPPALIERIFRSAVHHNRVPRRSFRIRNGTWSNSR